ncbi:MAG TPA: YitT family protein [Chitinophagaceae bacterium]|nr:YitT family protein [Chitinophagaceae bacterium]
MINNVHYLYLRQKKGILYMSLEKRNPINIQNETKIKIYNKSKRITKDVFLIVIGIFSATLGLKGFLLTNHFIDGGVTGISLLTTMLTNIPLPILIVCINAPFVYLGLKIINKEFAIKTSLAIAGLSISLALIEVPNITDDNLLVAIFGGFFLGGGIGFAVRGGAVIDGTEVLAVYLSRKLGTTLGDVVMGINVIIFCTAAYFLGIEIALYSMITYLSASKTLDFIVEGIEEYIGVTIISSECEKIRDMIINEMGRGVTIYKGKRGYGKRGELGEIDIIYSVVTRLELNKMKSEMENIDPNAFIVMSSVKDTKGGMIKKRPLEH